MSDHGPNEAARQAGRRGATACFTFDHLGEPDEMAALYDVVERHGVRATFFVEGRFGDERPGDVATVVERGHELGMHGWAHEPWAELDPAREHELSARATDALERSAGVRPVAFRAPGGARSASTADVLTSLGYRCDASLGDGMRTDRLGPDLAQVPFVWPGVDVSWWLLRDEPAPPAAVRAAWLSALDKAALQGTLFVLVAHGFVTAIEPERLAVLEAVVAAAVADPRLQVCSALEVADRVLAGEL